MLSAVDAPMLSNVDVSVSFWTVIYFQFSNLFFKYLAMYISFISLKLKCMFISFFFFTAPAQAALLPQPLQNAAAPQPPINEQQDEASDWMNCDVRCKVCLSAESNTIFQPCQHVTCCNRCADMMNNCPICRAPIRDKLPAYIA